MKLRLRQKAGLDGFRWVAQAGSQALFLACPIYEVLYHGTRGASKTEALLIDFLKDVGKGYGPSWHGVLFRRTYTELSSVIKRSLVLFKALWPEAEYNATAKEWRWPTGEYLQFRYIQQTGEGGDYDLYHGSEIPWIGWEELCTWPTAELYLKIQGLCRSSDLRVAPIARIRATANPIGIGQHWVKKRFQLGGSNHTRIIDAGGLRRCAIFGFLEENKILLRADPMYAKKLVEACKGNPLYLKAWLYGSWDVTAGGMFDDLWDPTVHVVQPLRVPASWRIDRSHDWGSAKPFSHGNWAQSDGSDYQDIHGEWHATVRGDIYRIGEWYGADPEEANVGLNLQSPQLAEGIIERELDAGIHDRCLPGPADPSIFTETDGRSIANSLSKLVRVRGQQYKGPTYNRADNSRIPGWTSVRNMLFNAKPANANDCMRELPGLFVSNTCAKFLELFPVTLRNPDNPEDVDTHSEDHLQDEVRYRAKAADAGGTVSTGRVAGPAGDAERSRFAGQRNTGRVTWR
jgi:hypothetical protein